MFRCFSLALVCALVACTAQSASAQQIVLSEIGALGGMTSATGEDCDWVELRNVGPDAVDLAGIHLSDDPEAWAAWTFPAGTALAPGALMTVLASGRAAAVVGHWDLAVHEGQTFSYLTSTPPADWREPGFDDTAWPAGVGGFGYGDGDDNTLLPSGTTSVFLRRDFFVADPAAVVEAMLAVDADDSFVAFLNGREIGRSDNLGGLSVIGGGVVPLLDSEAVLYAGGTPGVQVLDLASSLQQGWNTFALQVHNTNSNSSDLSARPFLALGLSGPPSADATELPDWMAPPANAFHTNFKLSRGEPVILSNADGDLIDVLTIPLELSIGRTLGRPAADPNATCMFDAPSPGGPNLGSCFTGVASTPDIAPPSGWLPSNAAAIVPAPVGPPPPGTILRYTLDGSDPTPSDPLLEDLPGLTETAVVNIRAFAPDALPGPVVSRTYIRRDDEPVLPFASLVTAPDHLWDWNDGIYVMGPNASPEYPFLGANFWQPWSRFSRLEWFDASGEPISAAELDLEIHGGWSRGEPQKSFRLDFKNRYTGDLDGAEIFPDNRPGLTRFNNLNLRNGGQSSWTNKLQDAFLCDLAIEQTHTAAAAWQPMELWLNGEYWGVYGAREKTDERWASDLFDMPEDAVDMLNQWEPLTGPASAFEVDVAPVLALPPTSDAFASAFDQTFDIPAFIDYHIFEIHGQNVDWLSADWGQKNLKYFRDSRAGGGPWRYVLFDLDACFGAWGTAPGFNALQSALNPPFPSLHSDLLEAFLDHPDFRCGFATRYNDLLNTIFEPAAFEDRLNVAAGELTGAMPRHVARWSSPQTTGFWLDQVGQIANHNTARVPQSRQHLRNAFGWSQPVEVSTTWSPVGGGTVQVNGWPGSWPLWSGEHFGECPIALAALPAAGYGFVGWTCAAHEGAVWFDADQPFLSASLTTEDTFEAHFEPCLTGVVLDIVPLADGGLEAVALGLPAPATYTWWQGGVAIGEGPILANPPSGQIFASLTLGECTLVSAPWGDAGSGGVIPPTGVGAVGPASAMQLQASPNPASDRVTIGLSGAENGAGLHGELMVVAVASGGEVLRRTVNSWPVVLDLAGLPAGVYAVRLGGLTTKLLVLAGG